MCFRISGLPKQYTIKMYQSATDKHVLPPLHFLCLTILFTSNINYIVRGSNIWKRICALSKSKKHIWWNQNGLGHLLRAKTLLYTFFTKLFCFLQTLKVPLKVWECEHATKSLRYEFLKNIFYEDMNMFGIWYL